MDEAFQNFPVSYEVEQLWSVCAVSTGLNAAHNIVRALRFEGELDTGRLIAAIQSLTRRHQVLRASFHHDADRLVQRVRTDVRVPVVVERVESVAEALLRCDAMVAEPFVLTEAPLVRSAVFECGPSTAVVLLCVHHLIADGASFDVLLDDLRIAYESGALSDSPAPPYSDYAAWQRERLTGNRVRELRAFWREQLAGVEKLGLPTDRARPAMPSGRGDHVRFEVGREVTARVRELARAERTTPLVVLLGALHVLLAGLCGQRETPIAVGMTNRREPWLERVVGLFVNSAVVRATSDPHDSFRAVVRRCDDLVMDALEHSELPFSWVAREVAPERDLSRNPVYQVGFNVDGTRGVESSWGSDTRADRVWIAPRTAKIDLEVGVRWSGDTIDGFFCYSTDLFRAESVEAMVECYRQLLDVVTAGPDADIADRDVATPITRHTAAEPVEPRSAPPPPATRETADQRGLLAEVSAIWSSVLGRSDLTDDIGFFDAGGNSLSLAILSSRFDERFGPGSIDLLDLFECPTIAEQAQLIAHRQERGRVQL